MDYPSDCRFRNPHFSNMRVLVTGSAGHLGEALVRTLKSLKHEVTGLDILESPFTTHVGSITDRSWVRCCMSDVQVVLHAAILYTNLMSPPIDDGTSLTPISPVHLTCWKRP
jgi:nucleoside-diphosphate-sugar epimerase